MFWPCETRTSTCRSFATISSGLYRFLAIAVLLDVKDIPQVGPLQWGRIKGTQPSLRASRTGTVRALYGVQTCQYARRIAAKARNRILIRANSRCYRR